MLLVCDVGINHHVNALKSCVGSIWYALSNLIHDTDHIGATTLSSTLDVTGISTLTGEWNVDDGNRSLYGT